MVDKSNWLRSILIKYKKREQYQNTTAWLMSKENKPASSLFGRVYKRKRNVEPMTLIAALVVISVGFVFSPDIPLTKSTLEIFKNCLCRQRESQENWRENKRRIKRVCWKIKYQIWRPLTEENLCRKSPDDLLYEHRRDRWQKERSWKRIWIVRSGMVILKALLISLPLKVKKAASDLRWAIVPVAGA